MTNIHYAFQKLGDIMPKAPHILSSNTNYLINFFIQLKRDKLGMPAHSTLTNLNISETDSSHSPFRIVKRSRMITQRELIRPSTRLAT